MNACMGCPSGVAVEGGSGLCEVCLRKARQQRVDELRARIASYSDGDRPMSPPASLLRELTVAEEAFQERAAALMCEGAVLLEEGADEIARLTAERAKDREAFERELAARDGDVQHARMEAAGLKERLDVYWGAWKKAEAELVSHAERASAQIVQLKSDIEVGSMAIRTMESELAEARQEVERLRSAVFVPPEGDRVACSFPSVAAAVSAGLNGFAYQLVGESYLAAAACNPKRLPVVVSIQRKGVVIDVEVRYAQPVSGGAS